MAGRPKKSDDKPNTDWLKNYKRIRKDWGDVNPSTKVSKNKKKYNRKKEDKKWRKEVNGSV